MESLDFTQLGQWYPDRGHFVLSPTADQTGHARWDRIPGWLELPKAIALQLAIKQLPSASRVVELGSFQGRSSIALAAVLPAHSLLYCVDHFHGSQEHRPLNLIWTDLLAAFARNVEAFRLKDRVRILVMTTEEAAPLFAEASVDLLFLDAAHDYDSVRSDLLRWQSKLRPGGFLFLDDYHPRWPGVIQAVQTLGLEGSLAAPALWLHRKPGLSAVAPSRDVQPPAGGGQSR